jgi:feruloyl esterase
MKKYKMRIPAIFVALTCLFTAIGLAIAFGRERNESVNDSRAMPNCTVAALSAFNIANLTITSATEVAASGLDPIYCDVIGSVVTDGEGAGPGQATFRAKLPFTWNNKYLASAPGALAGILTPSMNPIDLAASIRKGYAFVTNDLGHQGSPLDASWALISAGVPNKSALVDYFYRAQHQVTVATKELVTSFYGVHSIERSYFDGCSNAGRIGLLSAIRYPEDYDGIIAGAPAIDQRGFHLGFYKNSKAFLNAFIPPTVLPALDAAIRANCDGVDRVLNSFRTRQGAHSIRRAWSPIP